MRRLTVPFLLVAVAACTAPAGASNPSVEPTAVPSPSPSASPSASPTVVDPNALLLNVEMVGGFVMPDSLITRMPIQTIYADGRVFEQGAIPEIYPGPLVPPTVVSQLTPDGLAIVQQAIDAAGLVDGSYPPFGIADAPDTRVTVSTSSGMVTVTVGAATPDASFAPEEAAQRASVQKLLGEVANLPALVGQENVSTAESYTPDALRLVLRVGQKPDDGMNPEPLDWPLDTPIATFGDPTAMGGSRCGAVDGADAQSLWTVLSAAKQNQYFEAEASSTCRPRARSSRASRSAAPTTPPADHCRPGCANLRPARDPRPARVGSLGRSRATGVAGTVFWMVMNQRNDQPPLTG